MIKVLLVEDEAQLNQIVAAYLSMQGYQAIPCSNAEQAYDVMVKQSIDVIVSDIMMPDINGFEFATTVRQLNATIPILFLSARDDISAKQKGYKAGIDDYMVKPVELEELVLRIEALCRRANIQQAKKVTIGNVELDADALTATCKGQPIPLTVREFQIFHKLLTHPNHAFSRAQLMDEFWDLESQASLRSVDVYITRLRDKFSEAQAFKIVTVHGLGYKAVIENAALD